MSDNTDELIRLTRELDRTMLEGMREYNLSPLSISAVILARLSFLNGTAHGPDGLHDYYELLEFHSENVYKTWEVLLLDDEEGIANDNTKSADILQFPRKDDE